jgi:hypothetical protein
MSDLGDTVRALDVIHADISAVEKAAKAHADADDARFGQLQRDQGAIHSKLNHLEHMITVLHDNLIEGFRQQNIKIERRGKNGQ